MTYRAINGEKVEVERDPDGNVRFGTAITTKCDILTINGIIHRVNTVLTPGRSGFEFDDLGLATFNF